MRRLWTSLRGFARRLAASLRLSTEEREMREEMQFHLDMAAAKLEASGLTREQATRTARLTFGGVEQWSEVARDEARGRALEEVGRDVHYAIRSLGRAPIFALTVIGSLALGIAAVSTVWTVTERVVLRPLPYGDGGRLVFLWTSRREKPDETGVDSYPDYLDWTASNPDIQRAAVFNIWAPTLTDGGNAEPLVGSRVSAQFFDVFGVQPMLGRGFRADEDVPNGPPVAVIAYSLWQRRFHGDRSIVGRTIGVNGYQYTVVGVMPPTFRDPEPFWKRGAEIWRPIDRSATSDTRNSRYLRVVARLRPGVSIERAQRDLSLIAARLTRDYPETNRNRTARVVPIQEQVVGSTRPVLLAALGGAICLLLIVCGNVASLMLARYALRAPELAVRAAMGAARVRIARLLTIESLVLSFAGATLGLAITAVACALLRHYSPPNLPRVEEIRVDLVVVAATALCAVVAAVLFGVLPSLTASRVDLTAVLHAAGGRATGRGQLRNAIVVGELAFSLVLLVAAGLLLTSVRRLNAVPLGFDPDDLVTFDVRLLGARYASDSSERAFFTRLTSELRRTPGISGAVMTSSLPLTGYNDLTGAVGGATEHPVVNTYSVHLRSVSPGYFGLLRIPLAGREFTDGDTPSSARVAIINRAAAHVFYPGENPIGRRFLTAPKDTNPALIVGVANDVRFYGPTSTPEPELFLPVSQYTWGDYAVIVRGQAPAATLYAQARAALEAIDPDVPLSDNASFADIAAYSSARQRYYATVFGAFALAAVLLSAIGIFGVIAYAATQRRREIAIRMALGAQTGQIAKRFVANAALLVLLGVALGATAAVSMGRALASLLFGVSPADVVTIVGAALLLGVVAMVASIGPALAATRSSPSELLK